MLNWKTCNTYLQGGLGLTGGILVHGLLEQHQRIQRLPLGVPHLVPRRLVILIDLHDPARELQHVLHSSKDALQPKTRVQLDSARAMQRERLSQSPSCSIHHAVCISCEMVQLETVDEGSIEV